MSCKLLLSLCFVLKLPHSAVFKLSTFTKLMYRDNLISGIILKRFFFFIILSFFFKSYFTIKSFCLYEIISSRYNKKTTEYYHCFSSSDHTFWLFSIVSIYSAYKKKPLWLTLFVMFYSVITTCVTKIVYLNSSNTF